MIAEHLSRLGIGISDPGDLGPIFDEAQDGTERTIHHYLRDAKTNAALRELSVGLLIDFVVDASKVGGLSREMLFGINRFEHTNAPGNPFADRVPATFRRFGASVFFDEATGTVHALTRDDSPKLEDGQIATLMGGEDKVRDFKRAQDFMAFSRATTTKVAESLDAFLAACTPCDDPSPANDDYPKYE